MKKITMKKIALFAAFTGLFLIFSHAARAQTVDSFNPNANGTVQTVAVQTDGKIIIGGDFTQVAGTLRNRIARVNADGTLDTGFDPNASDSVSKIVLQSDGKILVGGNFATIGGQTRNGLARLNADGTVDSFNPNPNFFGNPAIISAIAVQTDGKIVIGGFFFQVGAVSRFGLARVNANGTLDTGFTTTTDQQVNAVTLQADGKILVGGSFATIGGQTRNRIARLNTNGTVDSFNPNADSFVNTIAVQTDGKILIGGNFTTLNPNNSGAVTRNFIARLNTDGTVDSFNPNGNGQITTIVVQTDGKILVGGDTTNIGGQTRNRIARLNTDGTADSFNPNADITVFSIAAQTDGKILIGGNFTTLNPNNSGAVTRNFIARLIPAPATAAGVSIGGRVSVGKGSGLGNAVVTLTTSNGVTRTARTGSFGYYHFENVGAGQTMIVSVISKRFTFTPQVVSAFDDIADLNFNVEF